MPSQVKSDSLLCSVICIYRELLSSSNPSSIDISFVSFFSASAFAAFAGEKGRDANWQLKDNGVMTGVVSSSMSGTRVSGFRQSLIGNNEKAKTYARDEIKGES